jgi:hypothetical protein
MLSVFIAKYVIFAYLVGIILYRNPHEQRNPPVIISLFRNPPQRLANFFSHMDAFCILA